jgi:NAD(P)-dependent dehydrogenase (short-subunit alcohol dehydrogenase family)
MRDPPRKRTLILAERTLQRQSCRPKRTLEPGNLVGTVLCLADETSRFVTGQTLVVDAELCSYTMFL